MRALIDLLKVVDAAHGGRFHTELARIARTLGIEIPPVATPAPDRAPAPAPPGRVRGWISIIQMIIGLRKKVEAANAVLEGLSRANRSRGLAAANVSIA
jgi:hypothetical protein